MKGKRLYKISILMGISPKIVCKYYTDMFTGVTK